MMHARVHFVVFCVVLTQQNVTPVISSPASASDARDVEANQPVSKPPPAPKSTKDAVRASPPEKDRKPVTEKRKGVDVDIPASAQSPQARAPELPPAPTQTATLVDLLSHLPLLARLPVWRSPVFCCLITASWRALRLCCRFG